MADGSVTIKVDAETKQAQAELAKLERTLEKAGKAMDKTGSERNAIVEKLDAARQKATETQAAIDAINAKMQQNQADWDAKGPGTTQIEYDAFLEGQKQLQEEAGKLKQEIVGEQKEVEKLEKQEQKVTEKLKAQTEEYEKQKAAVGELRSRLMRNSGRAMEGIRESIASIPASMNKGFKWILKWGLGIRSLFILVRKLKSAIKEGFTDFAKIDPETKANVDNLKASLNALKLSWGAAFAPIYNAVAPSLRQLVDWLTEAGNAVSKFIALMTGKSTYKKAVRNMNSVKDSAEETQEAIEEAKNQLMGFDEINKLDDSSSKGSSDKADKAEQHLGDIIEEIADINDGSFVSDLALTAKDVLFDWSDLTEEQIVEKAIAGLTMLGGAILGGMIGGVPGVIIGAAAGLAFGILLDACTFNHDGKVDPEEIAKIVNMALLGATGGVIGFALGGPAGAAFGISAGLALSLLFNKTIFNGDGVLDKQEFFNCLALAIGAVGGGIIGGLIGGPAGALIGVTLGLAISFSGIKFGWDKVKAKIDEFFGRIKEYFNGYIEQWKKHGGTSGGDIAFYCIMGFIQGMVDLIATVYRWIRDKIVMPIIKYFKEMFGIASPSKVFADIGRDLIQGFWNGITEKWNQFTSWIKGKWDSFKRWWSGLELKPFKFKLPHLSISYRPAGGTISKLLGISSIPSFSVQWYAKGGIVDGATLFGAGEAGKEAIVPLERNTGWIKNVANEIFDIMSSRFDGALAGMPAMAGYVIPPKSANSNVSDLYDAVRQGVRDAMIGIAGSGNDTTINFHATFNVNGKEFYRASWPDLKAVEREHGKSLVVSG